MASSSSFSSSSSYSSSSSNQQKQYKHDVFLSFRGEDTRDHFVSHLHSALIQTRIKTYIDYKLKKGDEISPALIKAIEESKVAVIIFSENYANSSWCLDELMHILRCKEEKKQLVIPVFYHIDPSHVRKQKGSYEIAFSALEKSFEAEMDKVENWRKALTKTANLVGWDSSVIRQEALFVKAIVEDILMKLKSETLRHEYKGLVGIHKRIEKIESLLYIASSGFRTIGIWGIGGIGKTTLARIVFYKLSSQFEACCFLENIGRKWKTSLGQGYCENEQLKKQLISTLLREEIQNTTSQIGSAFDEERLRGTKVLLVLDDVTSLHQLELLAGDVDSFGLESRIIVTTRDKKLLKNRVNDDQVYKVEGLNFEEGLELFHLSAFRGKNPRIECIEMSKKVVNYAKSIPLALKVLGSYFGCLSKENWESALDKLKNLPNDDIQYVLRVSYDGLDKMQKDIFLDIACFFEGDDRDDVERILDHCGFFANIGIDDLVDKSLITIVDNKLRMHDLVQGMGHHIVDQESFKQPGKRSRLWRAQDIVDILKNNTGTEMVEGISLDMSEINKDVYLSPTVFEKMHNIRFLKIHNKDDKWKLYFPEDLQCLPEKLRYLHWDQYPCRIFPPNFNAEFLVELIMPNSQVEKLWNGVQNLSNLRKIDLSNSGNLTDISSVSQASNVEHLYLENCTSLSKVQSHFKDLDKLQTLFLEGCSSVENFPELPRNIICTVLSGTKIEEVPSSIFECLSRLQILCMRNCKRLLSLPSSICELQSLTSLSLSGCSKLKRFPEVLRPTKNLTIVELDGTPVEEFPLSIKNMIGINHLNVNVLENIRLLPFNVQCISEVSKHLHLRRRRRKLQLSKDQLPLHYLEVNQNCSSTPEILSISRTAVQQSLDDSQLCGREILFYNAAKFPHQTEQSRLTYHQVGTKDFGREIERSKIRREFCEENFGVCCLGNEIPKWFCERDNNKRKVFHENSPEKFTTRFSLPKGIDKMHTILGFAVCVVVEFKDNKWKEFKLLCHPHFVLRDGRIFSWDFYWNYNYDEIKQILYSFDKFGKTKNKDQFFQYCETDVLFDFFCVDDNYEPLKVCNIKQCEIRLIFEDDSEECNEISLLRDYQYDAMDQVEPEPSASGLVDSGKQEKEDNEPNGCIELEIVAIPSNKLAKFSSNKFCKRRLFFYTLELLKRGGKYNRIVEAMRVAKTSFCRRFLFYNVLELHERLRSKAVADGKGKFTSSHALSDFKRELNFIEEDIGGYRLGNKIPSWFDNQSEGSSIRIELPPNWLSDKLIGFFVCVAVDLSNFDSRCFKLLCRSHYEGKHCRLLSWDFYCDDGCTAYYEVDHVLNGNLDYDDRSPWHSPLKSYAIKEDIVAASFQLWCVDENNTPLRGAYVTECGVRLIYMEDIRENIGRYIWKSEPPIEVDVINNLSEPSGSRTVEYSQADQHNEPSVQVNQLHIIMPGS